MRVFEKPSDALAALKGAPFRLKESSGGRPKEMLRADGSSDWDAASFNKALADGELPRGSKYIFRPLENGKVSSRSLKLDLSFAEDTVTVEGPGGTPDNPGPNQVGMAYLQDSVVQALLQTNQDLRDEIYDLKDDNKEIVEENNKLKLEVQELKHKLERAADEDSITQMVNKFGVEFLRNGGGNMLAHKFIGAGDAANVVGEAAKAAANGVGK